MTDRRRPGPRPTRTPDAEELVTDSGARRSGGDAAREGIQDRRHHEALRSFYVVGSVLLTVPVMLVLVIGWRAVPALLLVAVGGCFVGAFRIVREPRFGPIVAAVVATAVAWGLALWSWSVLGGIGLYGVWCLVVMLALWISAYRESRGTR